MAVRNFYCFKCEAEFTHEYKNKIKFKNTYGKWSGIKCPMCKGNAKLVGTPSRFSTPRSFAIDKITAIKEDDKGNQVAVNKKGKPVDNYYKNDSRGWKRAGKKISSVDSHDKKVNYR